MLRRDFLKLPVAVGGSALSAGLGLSLLPVSVSAQDGSDAPPDQFLAVYRYPLGDWTVTALSDGYITIGVDALQNITTDAYAMLMTRAHANPDQPLAAVNAYVVDTGTDVILIDCGTGDLFGPTLGQMTRNLTAAGYAPEAVTQILVTHLHPDHIGGSFADGAALFPNAKFCVSATEHGFFSNADMKAAAPEFMRSFWDIAGAALAAYGERVTLFDGENEVLAGITAQPLPGHTPGHVGYRLDHAGESLLIWGDIIHVPQVQFARPEVTIAFDVDPATAAATRTALLPRLATERQLVAGMHLPFPGIGYIETTASGYRFTPAPWRYF